MTDTVKIRGARFRAYQRKDIDSIPELRRLSPEQILGMKAVSAVLPFRVNNYVVEQLIRWDGVALPSPEAEPRPVPTWSVRALGALALAALARALTRWVRRRRSGRADSRDPARAPGAAPDREASRAAHRS